MIEDDILEGKVYFESVNEIKIDQELKTIIIRLLDYDWKKRISFSEIIGMKWFTHNRNSIIQIDNLQALQKIVYNFNSFDDYIKKIHYNFVHNLLSEREREMVFSNFYSLDKNNNGRLEMNEISDMFKNSLELE